jgi:DNA-binding phage protein
VEGNYSNSDSIGNIRGKYATTGGMVSISRSLGKMVHLSLDWTLQQYSSPTFAKYNRLVQTAGVGIAFAPGDVPLHIW